MNKNDSERIAGVLENIGYQPAFKESRADLIVINMCSVRQSAVDRVYGKIENLIKLKKNSKKLKTVLFGCILKKDKKNFEKKFDIVLNIKDLYKLPKILKIKDYSRFKTSPIRAGFFNGVKKVEDIKIKPKYSNNFSAYIPIMKGCDAFCSYCVVPYTRGPKKYYPAQQIISEIEDLIKNNYKEIWLLGQNVTSYCSLLGNNKKSECINFPKLLQIIDNFPGKFWIRFTAPHLKDFSDELIEVIAKGEKITEYLNLPVQSGDNSVLKRMNRPYTIENYKRLIKKIRKKIYPIGLSTDIIVGFPGETKKQFQNTAKLLKELKFDMAYISQYSPRPETAAAQLKDNVNIKEKHRREKILTEILKQTALENNKKYIGKTVEVLVEKKQLKKKSKKLLNTYLGKTRTYKTVKFNSHKNLIGKFVTIKITDALPWGLSGQIETIY